MCNMQLCYGSRELTDCTQYSPNCHRVHIALEEVKADYTPVTINLMEKPEWYNQKVNTITGKVERPFPSFLSV